jgi:hypothetical protein
LFVYGDGGRQVKGKPGPDGQTEKALDPPSH